METKNYVTYLRVSTRKQGASGLGLEAQRRMCGDFVAARGGVVVAEFTDVESGTHRDRRGLADALEYCKAHACALVTAKLDRLARDVEFCFRVVNTGVEIHFTDMPTMNTLLLGVFASVAQYERELTSERTRKALAAKRERGEATGGASGAWRRTFNARTKEQHRAICAAHGTSKNARYLASDDVRAFVRVLMRVFPDACPTDDPRTWEDWKSINTKRDNRRAVLTLMQDFRAMNPTLFNGWDFSDIDDARLQVKLSNYIHSLKVSAATAAQKASQQ